MLQRRLSQNANQATHTTKLHLQAYARLREENAAVSDEDHNLHVGSLNPSPLISCEPSIHGIETNTN